jgi:branched-chain amino acid transport system ATP-binding protein
MSVHEQDRDGTPTLALQDVTGGYGRTTVVRDIDIVVPPGTIVALMGPNGAGKTTLLRAAAGHLRPSSGVISVDGVDMTRARPAARARKGLCLIPEGRGIFRDLTVRENLVLQVPPWEHDKSHDRALEAFPVLGERYNQVAGSMSGGQQQMLALARCFLARPKVVLLDEVSMGLAPRIIDEIFEALQGLARGGVSLLLVEQYVSRALAMADWVYLLDRGRVTLDGLPADIDEGDLVRHYLGGDVSVAPTTASNT